MQRCFQSMLQRIIRQMIVKWCWKHICELLSRFVHEMYCVIKILPPTLIWSVILQASFIFWRCRCYILLFLLVFLFNYTQYTFFTTDLEWKLILNDGNSCRDRKIIDDFFFLIFFCEHKQLFLFIDNVMSLLSPLVLLMHDDHGFSHNHQN